MLHVESVEKARRAHFSILFSLKLSFGYRWGVCVRRRFGASGTRPFCAISPQNWALLTFARNRAIWSGQRHIDNLAAFEAEKSYSLTQCQLGNVENSNA